MKTPDSVYVRAGAGKSGMNLYNTRCSVTGDAENLFADSGYRRRCADSEHRRLWVEPAGLFGD